MDERLRMYKKHLTDLEEFNDRMYHSSDHNSVEKFEHNASWIAYCEAKTKFEELFPETKKQISIN